MRSTQHHSSNTTKGRPTRPQRKLRAQQIIMVVIGLVVILSMVFALVMNY